MSTKAEAYRRWLAYRRRALAAREAVGRGVWLGLLDREDLHAVDQVMYSGRTSYRADPHNLRGLFPWESSALREHFPAAGSVLVVGAGGGRELIALTHLGYRVTGYECNADLVEYGRDLLRRVECDADLHFLPRDAAPPDGGPYDAVVVGWSAYMLIAGSAQRIAFLRGLRARVRPGAPLLISFFSRSAGRRAAIVAGVANAVRTVRRRPPVEVGDDLVPNFVHRFTPNEVQTELRDGGFVLKSFRRQGTGPYDSGYAVGTAADLWIVDDSPAPATGSDARRANRSG